MPETSVSNDELARRLSASTPKVTAEWIERKTGIRERRISRPGVGSERNSELAARAARAALAAAGRDARDVDQILVATITPDTLTPSTSARVQHLLGATHASVADVNAACTGFISALRMADQAIRCGDSTCVVVIGSEVLSSFVDWDDYRTCILFGDGAGAVVVETGTADTPGRLSGFHLGVNGAESDIVSIPAGGSWRPPAACAGDLRTFTLTMDGPAVSSAAEAFLVSLLLPVLGTTARTGDDVWMVPHQANLRIIERVAEQLQFPMTRVLTNITRYGNTSAASIPLVLDEAWRSGAFRPGATAVLAAIGAGFTFGRATVAF